MPLSFLNIFTTKKKHSKTKKLRFQKKHDKIKSKHTKTNSKHDKIKSKKCCKFCGGRYWGTSIKCEMGVYPKCKQSGCKNKK